MEWRTGDMIDICRETNANGVVFTANSVVVKRNNVPTLITGAGAAKRIQDVFPSNVPTSLGQQIFNGTVGVQPDYYLTGITLPSKENPDLPFYIFALQVKRDYKLPGDIELTKQSLSLLVDWCKENPDIKLVMNCPLIGLGGFSNQINKIKKLVEDILSDTNVIVTIL